MTLHKYLINSILILSFLIAFSQSLTSQVKEDYNGFDVKISPRITIGYTFGAGVNCGFDLAVSAYRYKDIMAGIHLNYYMVFKKLTGMHSIKGIMLSAETQYVAGRLGFGRVSRSWGLRNINKAGAWGLMVDGAVGADEYRAPWIGFKGFIFDRRKWGFHDLPSYTSVYAYYKTQNIEIYKQGPPPIVEEDDDE